MRRGALNPPSLCGVQSGAQQNFNSLGHGCKALVFGQALAVAKVNLLHDDRKFETRESEIESDLGSIAPRFSRVVLYEFFPCKTAGMGCGSPAILLQLLWIRCIHPIGQCSAEI